MRPSSGVLGRDKSPPSKVALVSDDAAIVSDDAEAGAGVEENVRKKRGVAWVEITDRPPKAAVPSAERVAFLRVVKYLRSNSSCIQLRDMNGHWRAPKNAVAFAAELLQIAPRTADRIHAEFQSLKTIPEDAGPPVRQRQFVLDSVFGKSVIKQWVHEHLLACVAIKQRATFRSITKFLNEVAPAHIADSTSMILPEADLKEVTETACSILTYTNVRRWALRQGMKVTKLGKIKKTFSAESAKIQAWYARFCREYINFTEDPNVVIVFADESFVNQFHARSYAVVDIGNKETRLEGAKKGMRWCMATAITRYGEIEKLDPMPHPPGNTDSMSGRWTFCPNRSQQKQQGRDYHKSFSEESYIPYFKERLVPACERAFPGKKLVFVFDNATYHVVASYKNGDDAVGRDKSMATIANFLEANGRPSIPRKASGRFFISRAELIVQFDQLVAELGCDLQIFCRSRGHDILLTPPRASHFQPIEMYWAAVKNEVAAQFNSNRNFQNVRQQLLAAFDNWGTQQFCTKLFNHCTEKIRAFHDLMQRADASQDIEVFELSDSSDSDEYLSGEESSHSGDD